jgi:O-antigen/teichoic acid export membrane protein
MVGLSGAGARLLTLRGLLIRAIAAAAGLALLALVSPAQLGLLAVVRGAAATVEQCAELGLTWPLLRQRTEPTREEYAALAGAQLLLVLAVAALAWAWPSASTAFGALDSRWRPWMLATLGAMIVLPLGTGARVRLERQLRYRRLALLEVSAVLAHAALVLGFTLAGRFGSGVFVAQILLGLYLNLGLYLSAPGPLPSLAGVSLLRRLRSSAGFSAAYLVYAVREQTTPLVVAALLGLRVAGIWAFSVRLGECAQFAYEGFARVGTPAAARLAGDAAALRRLAAASLEGAAALALPAATILTVSLPVVASLWPRWAEATHLAQVYVPCVTLAGVAAAALGPVALIRRGWTAVFAEHLVPLAVSWAGFGLLRALGRDELAWVVVATALSAIAVLMAVTGKEALPAWSRDLTRAAAASGSGFAIYFVARGLGCSSLATAVLASGGVVAWARPRRYWAQLQPLLQDAWLEAVPDPRSARSGITPR